jgi:hypothetical protein
MSQTASFSSPEVLVEATCLRKERHGAQRHLVTVSSALDGTELISLELTTYRGVVTNVTARDWAQLSLW